MLSLYRSSPKILILMHAGCCIHLYSIQPCFPYGIYTVYIHIGRLEAYKHDLCWIYMHKYV